MSGIKDKLSSFGTFCYNSDEGKVLGRGARNWAEIGLFYLVYYTCLAGVFVGFLAIFYQTVDEAQPKLTGTDSLLKGNPGMGFQPMTDVEYTLIRFRKPLLSYKPHKESIMKVLKPYKEADDKGVPCDMNNPPPEGKSCTVDYANLTAECNEENFFGYKDQKPCVLMRLNRIFGWMPQPYTEENVKNSGASEELQAKILANPDMIYIDCVGENPADRDNLGEIRYFPTQGYPHYYYPFTNQKDYMSPLVFVQFPNVTQNIALMVECKALAPNIHYDRTEKEGGVHFELLIDP
ncbi:sodium/potassium-transporting ATPase subunit beta-like [Littorina saxatilis]|uniref:Sodium/potassium-transporting ATPase subunit beta n=1 Tax=Littorina saxatilis TaxID=31220 RepID=A0AAN9ANY9_9CAEN